jgi:hypothetical protein
MQMIEDLMDMQERGVRDRILGYSLRDNPMARPGSMPSGNADAFAEWYARFDAWRFGWSIEDADRSDR